MTKKTMTLEHIDYSLSRWKTRLKRAMTAIDKLEKQRKRLAKAKPKPDPMKEFKEAATQWAVNTLAKPDDLAVAHPLDKPVVKVDDEIPSFLRRQSPDPIAEQIRQEQAETKKKKAQGRIAKMKAKQSGETKRMPLTGRAALEAIRGTGR